MKHKINDFCLVTDFVANGSFESLRNNVKYLNEKSYAVLVRLTDFTKKWESPFKYVNEDTFNFLRHSSLKAGDLIMSNVGEPGIVFIVPDLGMPMTLGPNSILIRPNKNIAFTKYLFHYFRSQSGKDKINYISSATTLKKFNKTSFRNLDIDLPPLAEQQRITAILDKAELVKQKRELAIQKLDTLAQSIFVEEVGNLNTNSKNLELIKLNQICSFSQGIQVDVDKQSLHKNNEHDVRFLRIIDFTQGNQEPRYVSNYGSRFFLKSDEIAMVRYGATTGFVCTGLDGVIANNLFKFTINDHKFLSIYIFLYLKSNYFQSQLRTLISGAAMPALNFGMLDKFVVPLISIEKQRKIQNQINQLEKNTKKFKTSFQDLSKLSCSLQNQVFPRLI